MEAIRSVKKVLKLILMFVDEKEKPQRSTIRCSNVETLFVDPVHNVRVIHVHVYIGACKSCASLNFHDRGGYVHAVHPLLPCTHALLHMAYRWSKGAGCPESRNGVNAGACFLPSELSVRYICI